MKANETGCQELPLAPRLPNAYRIARPIPDAPRGWASAGSSFSSSTC